MPDNKMTRSASSTAPVLLAASPVTKSANKMMSRTMSDLKLNVGPEPVHKHPPNRMSQTHHGAFPYSKEEGHQHAAIKDIRVGVVPPKEIRKIGNMPRIDQPKFLDPVPKYLGYHPSEGASMLLHGRTRRRVRERNPQITELTRYNRAVSCPSALERRSCVKVVSRLPGLTYYQPGVRAETVYGARFGSANEAAQMIREDNKILDGRYLTADVENNLKHYWHRLPLRNDFQETWTAAEQQRMYGYAVNTQLKPHQSTHMSWLRYSEQMRPKELSYNPGPKIQPGQHAVQMRMAGRSTHGKHGLIMYGLYGVDGNANHVG